MHFVAMLGFSVVGDPIRYDVSLTAVSAIIAIVAVGVGFSVACSAPLPASRILIGGTLAGSGRRDALHGMAACGWTATSATARPGARVHRDRGGRATVGCWLALTVKRRWRSWPRADHGRGVNGMHFTGMSAMSVRRSHDGPHSARHVGGTLLIPDRPRRIFTVLGWSTR